MSLIQQNIKIKNELLPEKLFSYSYNRILGTESASKGPSVDKILLIEQMYQNKLKCIKNQEIWRKIGNIPLWGDNLLHYEKSYVTTP